MNVSYNITFHNQLHRASEQYDFFRKHTIKKHKDTKHFSGYELILLELLLGFPEEIMQ